MPRNRGNQYLKALLIAWLSEGIFSFWMSRKGLLKQQSSCISRKKNENSHLSPREKWLLCYQLTSRPRGKPRQQCFIFCHPLFSLVLFLAFSTPPGESTGFQLEDWVWDLALLLWSLCRGSGLRPLSGRCWLASSHNWGEKLTWDNGYEQDWKRDDAKERLSLSFDLQWTRARKSKLVPPPKRRHLEAKHKSF